MNSSSSTRRNFLHISATGGAGILLANLSCTNTPPDTHIESHASGKKEEEDVSPAEDLMREHGILKRVMLVYEEIHHRIEIKSDFPPQALIDAAQIIRSFVEDYHEKLEEDYLFPRFEKAHKLTDLVETLKAQHQAGRRVTAVILHHTALENFKDSDDLKMIAHAIRQFNRMYAPHEAREDTVLFPAFHEIVSTHEYDALGEQFEKKENELFGQDGFEKMVDRVAGIEKKLGIYDLAQFTPVV